MKLPDRRPLSPGPHRRLRGPLPARPVSICRSGQRRKRSLRRESSRILFLRSLGRLATMPAAYLLLAGGVAAVTFEGEVIHPLTAQIARWVQEALRSSPAASGVGPAPAEARDVLPGQTHAKMSTARAVGGAVADRGAGFSVAAPIRRIAALRWADVASASLPPSLPPACRTPARRWLPAAQRPAVTCPRHALSARQRSSHP